MDAPEQPEIYTGMINMRRCKRYLPTPATASVSEFIKDRYRNVARPDGPFCYCGLMRGEHGDKALRNAGDVDAREQRVRELFAREGFGSQRFRSLAAKLKKDYLQTDLMSTAATFSGTQGSIKGIGGLGLIGGLGGSGGLEVGGAGPDTPEWTIENDTEVVNTDVPYDVSINADGVILPEPIMENILMDSYHLMLGKMDRQSSSGITKIDAAKVHSLRIVFTYFFPSNPLFSSTQLSPYSLAVSPGGLQAAVG